MFGFGSPTDEFSVYRPGLLHRLQRLEKMLKIDSSVSEPLGKPNEVWVVAERIHKMEGDEGWSPGKENRDNTLTQMWRDPDELVLIQDVSLRWLVKRRGS